MEARLAFELFKEFLDEGFDVLNIPKDNRLSCRPGLALIDRKFSPVHINEKEKKILFFAPLFELTSYGQDNPTAIRLYAYTIANSWSRALIDGALSDKPIEDIVTAFAIATIKGLQLSGSDPFEDIFHLVRQKIRELTNLNVFKTEAKCKNEIRTIIAINNDSSLAGFGNHLLKLIDGERISNKPLKSYDNGDVGSRTNPFDNIDDAANHIIGLEKERLRRDAFRNYIKDLPYFVDVEQRIFRIPWASAYCAYQNSPNVISDGFVVNQLRSRRFNLKPCLYNRKFLFRGQAEYYSPCVPNMFRKQDEDYFLKYTIFTCEMQILLQSHQGNRIKNTTN